MRHHWLFLAFRLWALALVAALLVGCIDGNNTGNHRSTVRSYSVDCGNAQEIGSGSCGLTVTSVSILGGGGQ